MINGGPEMGTRRVEGLPWGWLVETDDRLMYLGESLWFH